MEVPRAPRRVETGEKLAAAPARAGEGTTLRDGHVMATRDGVFEYDPDDQLCRVRQPRRPVAGTRRRRGDRADTDADLRDTRQGPTRSTSRDAAKLKKKKGRGDQGTWM